MELDVAESWIEVVDSLNQFYKRVDDEIETIQQQMKACKKKTELETKMAQEMKLHKERTERLAELTRRGTELDRVCASMAKVTIADNDQTRLNNAQENYKLAKELTGIRLNFSAPPNVAMGYIKNESQKLLQPFEIDTCSGDASEALWSLLRSTTAGPLDKENRPNNTSVVTSI